MFHHVFVATLVLLLSLLSSSLADTIQMGNTTICISSTNTYTAKVNLFAGELGYFMFEECGNVTHPTIGLVVGEDYTFIQKDRSNWMHPMGFGYASDDDDIVGALLLPDVTHTGSSCVQNKSCPHPRYSLNGIFLGNTTLDPVDIGLDTLPDAYEYRFHRSITEWTAMGNFSINFKFDDTNFDQDLFYFCHIHSLMAGRIKLIDPSTMKPVNEENKPDLGFDYDVLGEFDKQCGTYGVENSTLPNELCPSTFICTNNNTNVDADLQVAIDCYDAINCHMISGMTTGYNTGIPTVLFVHQMIPHHQNAVNMAKNLLRRADDLLYCEDLSNAEDQKCIIQSLLRGMINSQNKQIQQMRDYLHSYNYPTRDECKVYVDTLDVTGPNSN